MSGSTDLLQRQLAVLRRCAGGSQRFAQLQQLLAVPPSTLVRLLRSLCGAGLLRQESGGAYALAPGATALGLALLDHGHDADAAAPALAALARQTGASAAFWRLDGRRLILLAKCEIAEGFHYVDRFSHQPPANHVCGIVLIAALAPEERARHLRGAGAASRTLLARALREPVLACVQPWPQHFWRAATAVRCGGALVGAVAISRHARPDAATAERDRRCVAAAARRLEGELDGR